MTTQCPNCHNKMHTLDVRNRVYYGYQCIFRRFRCFKCNFKKRTREVNTEDFDELLAAKHKLDQLYEEAKRRNRGER